MVVIRNVRSAVSRGGFRLGAVAAATAARPVCVLVASFDLAAGSAPRSRTGPPVGMRSFADERAAPPCAWDMSGGETRGARAPPHSARSLHFGAPQPAAQPPQPGQAQAQGARPHSAHPSQPQTQGQQPFRAIRRSLRWQLLSVSHGHFRHADRSLKFLSRFFELKSRRIRFIYVSMHRRLRLKRSISTFWRFDRYRLTNQKKFSYIRSWIVLKKLYDII